MGRPPADVSECKTIVAVANELLDADRCELLVPKDDRLVVVEHTGHHLAGSADSYPRWTGIPGQAFSTSTACVIDDLQDTRSAAATAPSTSAAANRARSLCCVPVGDWGLFLAKSARPDVFTDDDIETAERLSVAAEAVRASADAAAPVADGGTQSAGNHAELLQDIGDILSHDLKNPLTVVKGNLELAQETGSDEYFDNAMAALDRTEELIDEVVFLARTGELIEQTETVELEAAAREAWANVCTETATLEFEESIAFWASRRGVSHMLENLIENSVTHAGDDVTVRIGALDDGFYLEDDGTGIPAEQREAIFDRGVTIQGGSSGLGLHIASRIAEAHGWTIQADAARDGGARFEITGVDTGPAASGDGSSS